MFQLHQQIGVFLQVLRFANQRGGELTVQTVQRLSQLGLVGYFDDEGGRAEHFLLQQRITLEQQTDVGLEQLRPRLIAVLILARQADYSRMVEQGLHTFFS